MADAVSLYGLATNRIRAAGQSVVAVDGGFQGALIVNPQFAEDQGIVNVEELYISLVGPATLGESANTIALQPGQWYVLPPGQTSDVYVNGATAGHKFSGYVVQAPTPFPPTPVPPGPFPPDGPTSVLETIPSYLYWQYRDDDSLQAFVESYNLIAQEFVDWFNDTGLPVYTGAAISGLLLDWVAEGLYGIRRPTLASGQNKNLGPLNTYLFNQMAYNDITIIGPQNAVLTTDDIFKRIITWHFYKGDGKVFNIPWLKRRVMRFLFGENGEAPAIDETYPVSVTFGVGNQVDISIGGAVRSITAAALYNTFALNTLAFNEVDTESSASAPVPNAVIFKEAVDSGALELPFQFDWVVNV